MAQLQFEDIFDRDKGKTGFVLGLGLSLSRNLELLRQIHHDKESYRIISCNNIDVLTDIKFDYWMLAQPAEESNPFCLRNAWQRYNSRCRTILLYTDCLDLTPRPWVAEHLTIDYIGYDQRHWKSEYCTWGTLPGGRHICCEGLIPGRLCIQEEFKRYTGAGHHYGWGDTVGVHMLALAVMLGLNPIYVSGIDLDYSSGDVHNQFADSQMRIGMGISSINNTPKMVKRIIEDMAIIRDCAAMVNTQIYDMDGGGRISEVFEHKPYSLA